MENIYHVTTSANIANIPTRPDCLSWTDVGPGSKWENGRSWMTKEIPELVDEGILTPISDMVLKQDFNAGFFYECGLPDCLTRGHFAMASHEILEPERYLLAISCLLLLP